MSFGPASQDAGVTPRSSPPLTWGQVCAKGAVDQGEVQHDGREGIVGLHKQVALLGLHHVVRAQHDAGERDAMLQAVLLRLL